MVGAGWQGTASLDVGSSAFVYLGLQLRAPRQQVPVLGSPGPGVLGSRPQAANPTDPILLEIPRGPKRPFSDMLAISKCVKMGPTGSHWARDGLSDKQL